MIDKPLIMGIVNATPDSFFAGSRTDPKGYQRKVDSLISEGADILDIGGYSTRPGAEVVAEQKELDRVIPVIEYISVNHKAISSIDTFRSGVATAAVLAGAGIVNDVSGGNLDSGMFKAVGKLQVPYILMHMRGTPATMNDMTNYQDVVSEVISDLAGKIEELESCGVKDIVIDPGFGFAKDHIQNFQVLKNLESFQIFGRPVLAGLSRKRMIWKTLGVTAEVALNGTTVLNSYAIMKGAIILRVHDVREAIEVRKLLIDSGLCS